MIWIKNRHILFCVLFSFVSFFVHAASDWYQHHDFLDGGFKMDEYNQCRQFIKKCAVPKGHLFPDQECIDKILDENQSCQQTQKLLMTIDFYYNGFSAEKVGKYVLIDAMTVADAQNNYYIVTESGYLVNTVIDPTSFQAKFKKKYKKDSDIITNFNQPKQVTSLKGKDIFTTVLSARECVACHTNLCIKVDFVFSQSGRPSELLVEENAKLCQRQFLETEEIAH